MADRARLDVNTFPSLLAVSNADGATPVTLWADPTTHGLITNVSLSGVSIPATGLTTALAVQIVDGSGNQITSFGTPQDNIPATGLTKALSVQILDGSGNQVTSFGGVTYTDAAAAPAHPVGQIPVFNNGGTINAVSNTQPLPVVTNDLGVGASYTFNTTGSAFSVDAASYATLIVTLSQSSGTAHFEISNDNSTWFTVPFYYGPASSTDMSLPQSSVTGGFSTLMMLVPLFGRYVRMVYTAAASNAVITTFFSSHARQPLATANALQQTGSSAGQNSMKIIGAISPGGATSPAGGSAIAIGIKDTSVYQVPNTANAANNGTGSSLLGVGLLEFDGTNYQRVPSARFAPSTTKLNTYSARITTNTTTTPTASTAYISTIVVTNEVAGTTSNLIIRDKQATPFVLLPNFDTTAVPTGAPLILNFDRPIKMTSGIDIITAGGGAATVDVFIDYYQ